MHGLCGAYTSPTARGLPVNQISVLINEAIFLWRISNNYRIIGFSEIAPFITFPVAGTELGPLVQKLSDVIDIAKCAA
jgi:hypothetical protein